MGRATRSLWLWCVVFVSAVTIITFFGRSLPYQQLDSSVVDFTLEDFATNDMQWKVKNEYVNNVTWTAIDEDEDYNNTGDEYNATEVINSMFFDIDKQVAEIDATKEDANGRKKRLPNFVLIGERKTGTTALLFFLLHHPQVKAPKREVHFFDLRRNFKNGLLWYVDQMQPTNRNEVTFEKSPSYFRNKWAALRMRAILPDVKLLLAVRDPIKRAISDFHFSKDADWVSGFDKNKFETFEEYALDTNNGSVDRDFRPLHHSLYSESLRIWLQQFNKDQLHIIDGDDIVKENPAHELRKMEEFMKLRPYFTEKMFYYRENRGYWCLRNPGCIGFGGQPHPVVKEEVIVKLRDFFRPFNEEFYLLAHQNFTW